MDQRHDVTITRVVCLAIDRWRSDFLGCYGNTWLGTPSVDTLAASGVVFDHFVADTLSLPLLYGALWGGLHALAQSPASLEHSAQPALPALAQQAGWQTVLLTDEPQLLHHDLAKAFDQRIYVASDSEPATATSAGETRLAAVLSAAAERAGSARRRELVWIHCQGMAAPWDAPMEYRCRLADPEDPPPPRFAAVPAIRLEEKADPDLLLGYRQAYGGQAMLLDEELCGLLDVLEAVPDTEQTLLIVFGTRGFPLGIHGVIGSPPDDAEALWGESLHVPLIVRCPAAIAPLTRSQVLVQPPDLYATLRAVLRPSAANLPTARGGSGALETASPAGQSLWPILRGESERGRDRAISVAADGALAFRTDHWLLRTPAPARLSADQTDNLELYVKPDDRHELNQIAPICPPVVHDLLLTLQQTQAAWQAGHCAPPLPETVVQGSS